MKQKINKSCFRFNVDIVHTVKDSINIPEIRIEELEEIISRNLDHDRFKIDKVIVDYDFGNHRILKERLSPVRSQFKKEVDELIQKLYDRKTNLYMVKNEYLPKLVNKLFDSLEEKLNMEVFEDDNKSEF